MSLFTEIGIREDILQGLSDLGFVSPTAIQAQIIPLMLDNKKDIVGLSQTGTGKTAAFGIPLIQAVDPGSKQTQALVLCPTRELCMQVARDLAALGRHVRDMRVRAVYGGASIDGQIRDLRQGPQIIVATPGRLLDLMQRRKVDLSRIRSVILDEADEMLNMGFQEALNAILSKTPEEKRTLLFSATMPEAVAAIAQTYMADPLEITIGRRNAGSDTVRHLCYAARAQDRYAVLRRIIDFNPGMYAIIFCRTREQTKSLALQLAAHGYPADALHGDLPQSQRDQVMQRFRLKQVRLLAATDVAARGLDVSDLTHVIHYTVPDDPALYTHRSGRTGRAGKSGDSLSIVHGRENQKMRIIEKRAGIRFESRQIPTGSQIIGKKLLEFAEQVKSAPADNMAIDTYLDEIRDRLSGLDRMDLIRQVVALVLGDCLSTYTGEQDPAPEKPSAPPLKTRKARQKTIREPLYTRFLINIGKKDGLHAGRLIGEINDLAGSSVRIRFGRIDIMPHHAVVEAESRYTAHLLGLFKNRVINGKPVTLSVADAQTETAPRAMPGPRSKPSRAVKSKRKAMFRKNHGKLPGN